MIENYSQLPKNINIVNNNEEMTFYFNNIPLTIKQNEEVSLKIDTSEELAKLYRQLKDLNLFIQDNTEVLQKNGYYDISFLEKVTNNNLFGMMETGGDKIDEYMAKNPFYIYGFYLYPKKYQDTAPEEKLTQTLAFGTLNLDDSFNKIAPCYRCFIQIKIAVENQLNTANFVYLDKVSIDKAIEVEMITEALEGFTEDGWYLYNSESNSYQLSNINDLNEMLKQYYISLQNVVYIDNSQLELKPIDRNISLQELNDMISISLINSMIEFNLCEGNEDPEGFYEIIRSLLYYGPLATIRVINIPGKISVETDWDLNEYLSLNFNDKDGCYDLSFDSENLKLITIGEQKLITFTVKADDNVIYSHTYNIMFNEIV